MEAAAGAAQSISVLGLLSSSLPALLLTLPALGACSALAGEPQGSGMELTGILHFIKLYLKRNWGGSTQLCPSLLQSSPPSCPPGAPQNQPGKLENIRVPRKLGFKPHFICLPSERVVGRLCEVFVAFPSGRGRTPAGGMWHRHRGTCDRKKHQGQRIRAAVPFGHGSWEGKSFPSKTLRMKISTGVFRGSSGTESSAPAKMKGSSRVWAQGWQSSGAHRSHPAEVPALSKASVPPSLPGTFCWDLPAALHQTKRTQSTGREGTSSTSEPGAGFVLS